VKLFAAALVAALAGAASAQLSIGRVEPFRVAVNRCFERAPDYPDHDRVEPHLPKLVCLDAISGVIAFGADGAVALSGAPGLASRASATGTETNGVAMTFAAREVPLSVERGASGYRAELVADDTPEDPAGDSGQTLVGFDLDAAGRVAPGTVRVNGRVACTFAPVCTGEEELIIAYRLVPAPLL
jgi:hypothetical protein